MAISVRCDTDSKIQTAKRSKRSLVTEIIFIHLKPCHHHLLHLKPYHHHLLHLKPCHHHLLLFFTSKEEEERSNQRLHTRHTVVARITRPGRCRQVLLVAVVASCTLRALRLIGQSIGRPKRALGAGLKDTSRARWAVEPLRAGFRHGSWRAVEPFRARIADCSPSGVHVGGKWAGCWRCWSYWTVVTDWTHIPGCSIWKVKTQWLEL